MFENVKTDQLNNVLLNYFSNANKLEHYTASKEERQWRRPEQHITVRRRHRSGRGCIWRISICVS
jgi:hypothetical protein